MIPFYSLHITFHIPQNKHCSYIGAHNYHVSSYDDLVKLRFYSIGSHYQHDLQKALFGFFRNTWHTFYRTWGKSNIDSHFKEEKKAYAETGRPIAGGNLRKGMDVYVVETKYDKETGTSLENPKVRIRGKLGEVKKVIGESETTIFPSSNSI